MPRTTGISRGFYSMTPLLHVGKNVGLSDLYIHGRGNVYFEDGCSISKQCVFITTSHDLIDFGKVRVFDIKVGAYAWVSLGATLLPGVNIGRGAVVGAKAVVSKDVLPYSVVVGNPARFIKFRMTADEIVKFEEKHFPKEQRYSRKEIEKLLSNSNQ